ncbi:hypothetical protein BN2476_300029 [Paraburkholderia piptadeniae]|uniref:Uncharacterized protein n=1 Tax=Paraburkholderia piptadeniae TaxID=1701573 RepID=A0A1N7S263_9BURK|nr:hypothetical protein [Paraburkholderia piptadeniae]SIT41483.1 hypothetical protein BN2476_300029 [Paraburkholderia piptadeniae]
MMHEYPPGEHIEPADLMASNTDTMPAIPPPAQEMLRQLYGRNSVAEGRYHVRGPAVALANLKAPVFAAPCERQERLHGASGGTYADQ